MPDPTDPKRTDDGGDERDARHDLTANARRVEDFLKRNAELGLEARVSRKYSSLARDLLSDSVPQRLDPGTKSEVDQVVGFDTSHVRIHVGERAQQAADALNARAFALGDNDIFFGRGEFQPGTATGKALLAHEMTHVYEQSQPVALATKEGIAEAGLRPGEETATRAEQEMFRQATEDEDSARRDLQTRELTMMEKVLLEEKIMKVLKERQILGRERRGR
ncbi:MAG: hypothetical protein AMXMBFR64_43320 [Myxococcales bacterium]